MVGGGEQGQVYRVVQGREAVVLFVHPGLLAGAPVGQHIEVVERDVAEHEFPVAVPIEVEGQEGRTRVAVADGQVFQAGAVAGPGRSGEIDFFAEAAFVKAAPASVLKREEQAVFRQVPLHGLVLEEFGIASCQVEGQDIEVAVAVQVVHSGIVHFADVDWGQRTRIQRERHQSEGAAELLAAEGQRIALVIPGIDDHAVHAVDVGISE